MAGRTWLAVLLCLGIWYFYLQTLPPPTKPAASQSTVSTSGTTNNNGVGTGTTTTTGAVTAGGFFAKALPSEASHIVKTQKTEITFSKIGGRLSKVKLKDYRREIDPTSPPIEPVGAENFSLSTLFSAEELQDLTTGEYAIETQPNVVTFSKTGSSGVQLTKEYRYGEKDYLIESTYRFSFPSGKRTDWGSAILPVGGPKQEYEFNDPLKAWEAVVLQDDSLQREPSEDLEAQGTVMQGLTNWLAYGNRYFATAVKNKSTLNPDVVLLGNANFNGGYLRYPLRAPQSGTLVLQSTIFVGPKVISALGEVDGLKALVDYGFFSFLCYPLLWLLEFFHQYVGNYGVAIILLTLLVRGLFYPLSVKSYRSMKEMQKLKPQIDALKEKYGDDREKMSREQMNLFKTHKVNPMAGCFPLLLQMPVFFALFSVLRDSIELFHAPFFGWIHDLSSRDPYFVYPVLMGVAMFLQMKITPQVGVDPIQRKMMMAMPIVFSAFTITLPSGLTLYIFVSTILGIAQQWYMMRDQKPAAAKVVKQASENGV